VKIFQTTSSAMKSRFLLQFFKSVFISPPSQYSIIIQIFFVFLSMILVTIMLKYLKILPIIISHNIGMFQFSKNIDFSNQLFFLPFRHFSIKHFLRDEALSIRFPPNFIDHSKRAFSNLFQFFELIQHDLNLNCNLV